MTTGRERARSAARQETSWRDPLGERSVENDRLTSHTSIVPTTASNARDAFYELSLPR